MKHSPASMRWRWLVLAWSLVAGACSSDTSRVRGDPQVSLPDASSSDASVVGPGPRPDGGPLIGTGDATPPPGPGGCKNLQCKQTTCPGTATTTLTGTVFAPNGTLPLYNVLVYVPNAKLPDANPTLSCDRCGGIPPGEPVVAALTDAHGVFQLKNMPVGEDIPLVIQVGKWRRQTTVPVVVACQENKLTDPQLTRLPRNHNEGDMPRIAVTTGGCDNLICLLPKLGIDPAEFGIAGEVEQKKVIFYAGNDILDSTGRNGRGKFAANLARMTDASALWGNSAELQRYDMALFSCECDEYSPDHAMAPAPVNKTAPAFKAVTDYLAAGGRVFGTDYQYAWYRYTPDPKLAGALTIQGGAPQASNPVLLDTTFPKGKALADWRAFVEPTSAYGAVDCEQVWDNFTDANRAVAQVWGSSPAPSSTNPHPRFVTINTPAGVPVEQQCGRAVHLDAHITTALETRLNSYPADCGAALENGEQVLAFFFFDVASCIQDEKKPPEVPPIVR